MPLYAVAWVYAAGLLIALGLIGALAASRRSRVEPAAAPTTPQIKWRCPICAYVFIEFEPEQYLNCPRCETLLDAAHDATVDDA